MDMVAWTTYWGLQLIKAVVKLLAVLLLIALVAAGLLGWMAYEIWRYLA